MDLVHGPGAWGGPWWSMDRVHGVVHGGPWGGPWWSMDRVHGVVHGPRSMFCIRPDSVDCTIMPSCMWRVFSFKIIPFNGTLDEFKGFQPVSIPISFCDLGLELYTQDLVKFLRCRLFQDIFFKMAGPGLAPASEDVLSFTVLLSGSKDYVCLFTATELRSCNYREPGNMYLLEMTKNLLLCFVCLCFTGLDIILILRRC